MSKVVIEDIKKENLSFDSFDDFICFIEGEVEFWSNASKEIGRPRGANFFSLSNAISSKINDYKKFSTELSKDPSSTQIANEVARIKKEILSWVNSNWLYSATPFSQALIDAYKKSEETGNAFKECMLLDRYIVQGNPPSMDSFSGAVLAYEFKYQDESQITKRRVAEKKAFSALRKRLENETEELSKELNNIKRSHSEWDDRTREEFGNWFESEKKNHSEFSAAIKNETGEKLKNYNDLFGLMCKESRSKIDELESLYREKLRLEGPAEYWRKRAEKLSFQGGMWAIFLSVFSLSVFVLAGAFFYSWLQKDPAEIGLPSLQGVGLFAATATVAGFIIKTLSKLTFSSYHLQRDAEEREQLSYFYLSLINEGAIGEASREIVLQSLFSRSDPGLLSGDTGPIMPTPADILKSTSKIKAY